MSTSPSSNHSSAKTAVVDFDIHGLVGIRLVDPPPRAVSVLMKQLGHFRAELPRQPDITVRFAEDIAPNGLKKLGLNQVGFTSDAFYIFDKRTGAISAQIPFETIGYECEIICRRQRSTIPLLFEIIRLTLLRQGYVPMHASAFAYNGVGALAMGWTKGGKTEALLSFGNNGARYVGDEWVIVSENGREMFGLPVLVTIWDWQFPQVPNLLPEISRQQRLLFKGIHLLDATHETISRGPLKNLLPLEMLGEGLPLIKRRLRIKAWPQEIFGERYCQTKTSLDKLFLMMVHQDDDIKVEPIDGVTLAQSMVQSNVSEQIDFLEIYKAFRFAFPDKCNDLLEQFEARQMALLSKAFANKEAYRVLHPYPVSFQALYEHMRPYCQVNHNVAKA